MKFEEVNAQLVRLISAHAKDDPVSEMSELAVCMTHLVAEIDRLRKVVADMQLDAGSRPAAS